MYYITYECIMLIVERVELIMWYSLAALLTYYYCYDNLISIIVIIDMKCSWFADSSCDSSWVITNAHVEAWINILMLCVRIYLYMTRWE